MYCIGSLDLVNFTYLCNLCFNGSMLIICGPLPVSLCFLISPVSPTSTVTENAFSISNQPTFDNEFDEFERMNEQRQYGILPPGASRLKRKDREPLLPTKRPPPRTTVPASATTKTSTGSKSIEITSSNKLLAGYMACEFLTKGTLLGHKFDGARSEAAARGKFRPVAEARTAVNGDERYKEITSLLMMKSDGGGCIPGIVNPTELCRWIEMRWFSETRVGLMVDSPEFLYFQLCCPNDVKLTVDRIK
ncbi:hypothetical protein L1987_86454 [Smallanthus sonchifolius]|uniref:Uncharacterized protein n=1 Tax=Smallanthus sonchifolius TaxID=185202 RepID=A0ACB8Y0K7_9ASTR|nr:hypothetical protein L1987_86454 [Smallanthus sonchifolius]